MIAFRGEKGATQSLSPNENRKNKSQCAAMVKAFHAA